MVIEPTLCYDENNNNLNVTQIFPEGHASFVAPIRHKGGMIRLEIKTNQRLTIKVACAHSKKKKKDKKV